MADSYKQLLLTGSAAKSLREVLTEPVTALLGVSADAAQALAQINIQTVFDGREPATDEPREPRLPMSAGSASPMRGRPR